MNQPIADFPTPTPSRSQAQDVFDAAVEAFLTHLPTFVSEVNAVALAMNLNSTTDTSATSRSVGTGSKTFTVSSGKSFLGGMYLIVADAAAPSTNLMYGSVTSYSGTNLVLNVEYTRGSGTYSSWVISQSAPSPGTGATGTGAAVLAMGPTLSDLNVTGATTTDTLVVNGPNSTVASQVAVSGEMTFDNSILNGIANSVQLTGGATTTSLRGFLQNVTFTPTADATLISIYNQYTLNSGISPTNVYGKISSFLLGPNALGGTITNFYGHNQSFSADASATTNITNYFGYRLANPANGTLQSITNVYGYRGEVVAGTGRWNLHMSGTGLNYLNGALLIGSDTDDTVNKLQVTGSASITGGVKARPSSAASGDLSPNSSTTDIIIRTALAAAPTINAPSGSPVEGQMLTIRLKDDGTGRAITWNAIYRAIGVTLPTTTVANKTHYCRFIYNATDVKWDCISVNAEV